MQGILFDKGRLLGTSNNEGPANRDGSHHIRTEKGAFLKQDDFVAVDKPLPLVGQDMFWEG